MLARCSSKCYAELFGFSKPIQTQSSIGNSVERAAHDPKMTSYLSHGVKAKMCETIPFINSVGTQYIASRAQIEKACDSLRQQGNSVKQAIGLAKVDRCTPTTDTQSDPCTMVEALVIPPDAIWSTLVTYTQPYPSDLLQQVRPYHAVLFSCKPHRPGCHQWKPVHPQVHDEIRELQPDVIVERYLDCQIQSASTRPSAGNVGVQLQCHISRRL